MKRTGRTMGGILALALCASFPALAAEPEKGAPGPTAEQRQKMAAAHQRMADCLKSDRPMSECRAGMEKACHDMGEGGCPMMGGGEGGMGHGHGMGGGAMKGAPPEAPKK